MILDEKCKIFFYFFYSKMSLEMMFHYVLDKKNYFRVKKKTFYRAKNRNFPKGLTHDFCQKIQKFSFIFLEQNEPKNNVSRCSR